jgi:hypothetical protein
MRQRRDTVAADAGASVGAGWGIWSGWLPVPGQAVIHRGDENYPVADVDDPAELAPARIAAEVTTEAPAIAGIPAHGVWAS